MSGSRIKTMVIAALVVINVLFLTFIVIDTVADARSSRQAIENACSVLRINGIEVDPDTVKSSGALRTMRSARDDEAEAVIARAFLGLANMTEQGVICLYENAERGMAKFSSGGEFEVLLHEGAVKYTGGTLRTVNRLLRSMQLKTKDPIVTGAPGSETVTVVSTYKGSSIFNCVIEFVFSGENLESAKGRYVTGVEEAEEGVVISTPGAALLGFLAAVRREEAACTRIISAEAGYQYTVTGSFGDGLIAPAWLITADSGLYIIDDATGEIREFRDR